MAGADSDCKRVNAGLFYEFLYLVGVGVASVCCRNVNVVFDTCEFTEFCFYYYAVVVCVFYYVTGDFDIVRPLCYIPLH